MTLDQSYRPHDNCGDRDAEPVQWRCISDGRPFQGTPFVHFLLNGGQSPVRFPWAMLVKPKEHSAGRGKGYCSAQLLRDIERWVVPCFDVHRVDYNCRGSSLRCFFHLHRQEKDRLLGGYIISVTNDQTWSRVTTDTPTGHGSTGSLLLPVCGRDTPHSLCCRDRRGIRHLPRTAPERSHRPPEQRIPVGHHLQLRGFAHAVKFQLSTAVGY